MPLPRLPVKVAAVANPRVVMAQRNRELAGKLAQDRTNRLPKVDVLVGVQVGGIPADEAAEGGDELDDLQPSDIDDTDRLFGGRNDDSLFAEDGDGNDTLDGGPGVDDCFGDPGDRIINCNNSR